MDGEAGQPSEGRHEVEPVGLWPTRRVPDREEKDSRDIDRQFLEATAKRVTEVMSSRGVG